MADNRNYWAVGTKWDGTEMLPDFVKKGYWADGYGESDNEKYKTTLSNVKIGDVFLAKSSFVVGQKDNKQSCMRLKNIGIVTKKEDWYKFKVGWLYPDSFQKDFTGETWYADTIRQMNEGNMLNHAKKIIQDMENSNQTKAIVDLLVKSKNLILTGAPGVGKTYKTIEIAVAIADSTFSDSSDRKKLMTRYNELIKSGQIVFTTFHQSLDYEEFVEGLKPDIDDDGKGIGVFSIRNGIFKDICDDAKDTESVETIDDFTLNGFEKYLQTINVKHTATRNKYLKRIKVLLGNETMKTSKCRQEEIPKYNSLQDIVANEAAVIEFDNDYDFKNWFGTPLKLLVKFKKAMDEKPKENSSQKSQRNFVLIIDEINRGNISKIFGELITLLEKDKRLGSENEITVTLPYSQDKFGVPSNLYIIGTMNTADRSIGAIDYALRRRFAFVLLKADKNVISTSDKYKGDTKTKAENLFDAIQIFIESNINEDLDADDLMVGHSYFLCETEDDIKRRLEYEIVPLLWEYQKDGIITCERKTLKDKISEWQNL